MGRQTHTYVVLEVSDQTYCEIRELLAKAGWQQALMPDNEIDMHGIALQRRSVIGEHTHQRKEASCKSNRK